jgi:hypothetical protein
MRQNLGGWAVGIPSPALLAFVLGTMLALCDA